MNRPLVCEHLTAAFSDTDHRAAEWSAVLLQHHRDIRLEIDQIRTSVSAPDCRLHRIEARLRRLGRAVLMHLELESCCLDPAVQTHSGRGSEDLQRLRQGYEGLRRVLESTADFLQREKLSHHAPVLNGEQQTAILGLLAEIQERLEVEDGYYRRYGGARD